MKSKISDSAASVPNDIAQDVNKLQKHAVLADRYIPSPVQSGDSKVKEPSAAEMLKEHIVPGMDLLNIFSFWILH
jgi:hypothetical protein